MQIHAGSGGRRGLRTLVGGDEDALEALEAIGDLIEVGDVALEALQPVVGAGVVDDGRLFRRADDSAEGAVVGRTNHALLRVDELVVVARETRRRLQRTADGVVDASFVVVGADVALGDAEPVGAANALPVALVGDGLADTLRRGDGGSVATCFSRRKLLDAGGDAVDAGDGVGRAVVAVPASRFICAARAREVARLRSALGGWDDSVILAGVTGRERRGVGEHAVVAHADEGGTAFGLQVALGVDADESVEGTLWAIEEVDDLVLEASLVEGEERLLLRRVVARCDVGCAAVRDKFAGLGGAVGFVTGAKGRGECGCGEGCRSCGWRHCRCLRRLCSRLYRWHFRRSNSWSNSWSNSRCNSRLCSRYNRRRHRWSSCWSSRRRYRWRYRWSHSRSHSRHNSRLFLLFLLNIDTRTHRMQHLHSVQTVRLGSNRDRL